jgi:hypothetical protein
MRLSSEYTNYIYHYEGKKINILEVSKYLNTLSKLTIEK